jgi:hypothetical protein
MTGRDETDGPANQMTVASWPKVARSGGGRARVLMYAADVLHERVPGGQGLCGPVAVGAETYANRRYS